MKNRLVLLHGWGATANDLRPIGAMLSRKNLELVCLNAPHNHHQYPGRQWYNLFPACWEQVPAEVEHLKKRLCDLATYTCPLEQTVLLGFSQGGAMALHAGCSLPLAGVISCSGYPHPNWQPPKDHPRVLLIHGTDDTIVQVEALEKIKVVLNSNLTSSKLFIGGHTIPNEMIEPIQLFLQKVI